jgi:hypothetical protein
MGNGERGHERFYCGQLVYEGERGLKGYARAAMATKRKGPWVVELIKAFHANRIEPSRDLGLVR